MKINFGKEVKDIVDSVEGCPCELLCFLGGAINMALEYEAMEEANKINDAINEAGLDESLIDDKDITQQETDSLKDFAKDSADEEFNPLQLAIKKAIKNGTPIAVLVRSII